MPNDHSQRALRPVEIEPGVLVHPSADRRLATEHWLLSTLSDAGRDRAREEWDKIRVTLLPLGTLFSAVRIPEHVVHAVAFTDDTCMVNEFLAAALDDGPVIHDPDGHRFYALVPASMPKRWHEAVDVWRDDLGVECLGRDTYLGVPNVHDTELDTDTDASYWAVSMSSAAMLCESLAVARLIAAAARRLTTDVNK